MGSTRADMMKQMKEMDLTGSAPRDHDEYLRRLREPGPTVQEPGLGDQLRGAYRTLRDLVKTKTGY